MAANGSIHNKERIDLQIHKQHSICMVLDYGSQYTQLIARRVRENGVCSLLLPGDVSLVSCEFNCPGKPFCGLLTVYTYYILFSNVPTPRSGMNVG